MLKRSLRIVAACLTAAGVAAPLSAQNRFEILARDAVNDVSGLRIMVVRDNQLSSCFALFTMDAPAAPPQAPDPAEAVRQQSFQRVRDAAERRDIELAQLNADFAKRAGRPYDTLTSNANYAVDPVLLGNYEQARRKINEAYDNVLRTEIPGSYPYAVPFPGMRTGDLETSAATTSITGHFARIDEALRRLNEAPRLAVSGPFACGGSPPPARR